MLSPSLTRLNSPTFPASPLSSAPSTPRSDIGHHLHFTRDLVDTFRKTETTDAAFVTDANGEGKKALLYLGRDDPDTYEQFELSEKFAVVSYHAPKWQKGEGRGEAHLEPVPIEGETTAEVNLFLGRCSGGQGVLLVHANNRDFLVRTGQLTEIEPASLVKRPGCLEVEFSLSLRRPRRAPGPIWAAIARLVGSGAVGRVSLGEDGPSHGPTETPPDPSPCTLKWTIDLMGRLQDCHLGGGCADVTEIWEEASVRTNGVSVRPSDRSATPKSFLSDSSSLPDMDLDHPIKEVEAFGLTYGELQESSEEEGELPCLSSFRRKGSRGSRNMLRPRKRSKFVKGRAMTPPQPPEKMGFPSRLTPPLANGWQMRGQATHEPDIESPLSPPTRSTPRAPPSPLPDHPLFLSGPRAPPSAPPYLGAFPT